MIQPIEKQSLVKALKRESFFSGDIFATAAAEIARLTSALTIAAGHVDSMSEKVDNADALAGAVANLYKPGIVGPWKRLQAALTAFQEGKAGKEP